MEEKEILESVTTLFPDDVYKKLLEVSRGSPKGVQANIFCSLFFLFGMSHGLTEAFKLYAEASKTPETMEIAFASKLLAKMAEVGEEINRIWRKFDEMVKEVEG